MLKEQPWIRFAPDLEVEWRQCFDEGLDVADFEALCADAARTGVSEDAAIEIARAMQSRPMRADYPFDEPSNLTEIQARRPQPAAALPPCDEKALPDKTAAPGWAALPAVCWANRWRDSAATACCPCSGRPTIIPCGGTSNARTLLRI